MYPKPGSGVRGEKVRNVERGGGGGGGGGEKERLTNQSQGDCKASQSYGGRRKQP